jgi:hypothetical protein
VGYFREFFAAISAAPFGLASRRNTPIWCGFTVSEDGETALACGSPQFPRGIATPQGLKMLASLPGAEAGQAIAEDLLAELPRPAIHPFRQAWVE